jgi:acetyltransferase-like isoleucine patch superfamily enzyme
MPETLTQEDKILLNSTVYEANIKSRTSLRFLLGILARLKSFILYSYSRKVARKNGAIIGKNTVLPLSLAKKANKNLIVGDSTSIQTDLIDLRAKVIIGNKVIIGSGVEILTCSHQIDSTNFEFKSYGIEIEDYAWVATKVFILPACKKIGRGAVCGAGSVVVKEVEKMSVVGGNPAVHIKYRKHLHTDLVVEALLGGDLKEYIKTRVLKNEQ